MQSAKGNSKKPVARVKKPILKGSWHGKDAWKLALKRMLSMLAVTVIYLIAGMLLSFESLWGRLLSCIAVAGLVIYYQYYQGMVRGENDAAFAEIMYTRQEGGRSVEKDDRARCFHPFKGMFAALVGAAPFVAFAVVYAVLTRPITYTLGVLPSWTEDFYHFDMIIGMDDRNIEDLMERAPDLETEKKIHRMTDYCRTKVADYVPDPYYGGAQGFENVLDILEDACAGLLTSLVPGN